jgi:tetratricopeptide (TPR) repeat protein
MTVMPENVAPHEQAQILWRLSELYFDAGDKEKGLQWAKRLIELNQQELDYFQSLNQERQDILEQDIQTRVQINDRMIGKALEVDPNNGEFKQFKKENEDLMQALGFEIQQAPRPMPKPKPIQDTTTPKNVKKDTVKF